RRPCVDEIPADHLCDAVVVQHYDRDVLAVDFSADSGHKPKPQLARGGEAIATRDAGVFHRSLQAMNDLLEASLPIRNSVHSDPNIGDLSKMAFGDALNLKFKIVVPVRVGPRSGASGGRWSLSSFRH